MKKILIACSAMLVILLLASSVNAVSVNNLKMPSGYEEISDGYYVSTYDSDVHIYIGELSLNDKLFETDEETYYGVSKLDDDIYVYIDALLSSSGVEEIVDLDEGKYVISIYNDDLISDPDNSNDVLTMEGYHQDLIKFNELNNLKPEVYS